MTAFLWGSQLPLDAIADWRGRHDPAAGILDWGNFGAFPSTAWGSR